MIYLYWLLPFPVLASMIVLMYRRGQHRLYPVFWAFLWFECCRLTSEAVFFRYSPKQGYFYSYWIAALLGIIFILLLLRTIFVTVVRRYTAAARIHTGAYELALGSLWAIGALIACHSGGVHSLLQVIGRVGQAVSFAEVGIFIFVVIGSAVLGVKWSEAVCGIAAGLGVLGAVDLLVYADLSQQRVPISVKTAGYIESAAYLLAVAIFGLYFLPHRSENMAPAAANPELLEWAESVRRTVSR